MTKWFGAMKEEKGWNKEFARFFVVIIAETENMKFLDNIIIVRNESKISIFPHT